LGFVGGWIPWNTTVGYSEKALVILRWAEVFPKGLLFSLHTRFNPRASNMQGVWSERRARPNLGSESGLRLVVQFPDGRSTARSDDPHRQTLGAIGSNEPILVFQGGATSKFESKLAIWLSPLPPPGPLSWRVSWPQLDVLDTITVTDLSDLTQRVAQAHPIW
jgi:hypothetical protein